MYKYPETQIVPDDTKWKQIKEFPMYWVSDHNHVFNMKRGTLVSRYVNQNKVLSVRLHKKTAKGVLATTRSVNKMRREAFGVDE